MRFDSYHPTINLIYFTAAIGLTISFNHPAYCGHILCRRFRLLGETQRQKSGDLQLVSGALCPDIQRLVFVLQSFRSHNLRQNFIGNEITLEALLYGLQIGFTAITVIMFFSCVFAVFSSDKIVYLFGRVSPKLSLFLSIILRMVPRIKQYGRRINTAQKGIGKSPSRKSVEKVCKFNKAYIHTHNMDAGEFRGEL